MRALYLILSLFALTAQAQENPILGRWTVGMNGNHVLLEWTIVAGNTCQGIYIWRSLDGTDFEEIGHIPGLCGSVDEPIDYSWTDPVPQQLAYNYYRIELGGQGFSTVKQLYVERLVNEGSLVFPNPSATDPELVFSNPSSLPVVIQVHDLNGRLLLENSTTSDRLRMPSTLVGKGTLIYSILSEEGTERGRFIML